MKSITAQNLGWQRPDNGESVLSGVSFKIDLQGDQPAKIGLIGPNGSGKTTLLELLSGRRAASSGTVSYPWDPDSIGLQPIGYLEQQPTLSAEISLSEYVDEGVAPITELRKEMAALEEGMAGDPENGVLLEKYGELMTRFNAVDGYSVEHRREQVLEGLDLTRIDPSRGMHSLSPGERTRAALARLLIGRPQLLLLDEPTNHLDLDAIQWLQGYLEELQISCVLVSHDRDLVESFARSIWHLSGGRLTVFPGSFSAWKAAREAERARQQHLYETQQKEIRRLEDALRERMQWSHSRESDKWGDGNVDRGFIGARAARHANRSKAIRNRIEKELEERKAVAVRPPEPIHWSIPEVQPVHGTAIYAAGLSYWWDESLPLLESVDLHVEGDERVAITGPNGSGKTTLLRILGGSLQPHGGELRVHPQARIALVSQEREEASSAGTVLEILGVSAHNSEARRMLAQVGLSGDEVFKQGRAASAGQSTRLAILKAVYGQANLLLLDEPTNHLDIRARESLEESLSRFAGAVVVVSHDRAFIEAIGAREVSLA